MQVRLWSRLVPWLNSVLGLGAFRAIPVLVMVSAPGKRRETHALLLAALLLAPAGALRAARFVDDGDRVVLVGNRHPKARPEADLGPADTALPMDRMILSLARRPGAQAELDRFLAEVEDPASPLYHRYLSPEEFGRRFGLTDEDFSDVAGWLKDQGFAVDEVGLGRGWINFSGNVGTVERAFRAPMHDYLDSGTIRHANSEDPSIPRALAPLVHGVVTLHNFPREPMHHGVTVLTEPEYTSGASHYLSPGDFATIYDVKPLYSAGITGAGQSVAIVARTDVNVFDVRSFRSRFGLPAADPVIIHNGSDPGNLGGGEETEADLDVEWAGAVAKGATVKFVVSASTFSTDGVDLSAQYIVNFNLSPAMSTSFGACESQLGASEVAFYNSIWSQAAAQGITAFVSSGDSGAAGCNGGSDTFGSGRAVSGLASTPYDVAVGGTKFADTANPSAYWASSNTSNGVSALGYIPEIAWNESGAVAGGSGLWSTGGGASVSFSKPPWQSGPGVPADGRRDVPDVSLSGAGHDGYLVVQAGALESVGGTSASSPSFASLMALIVQQTGARQGNANTAFYRLAAAQAAGTGPAVFHDVTASNNSVPGVTGYAAGFGYDLATGLGSVDAAALANNWNATVSTNDAVFVSQSVLATMAAGSVHAVSVTLRNGGTSTWTAAAGYRLGSLSHAIWGTNSVSLASGDSIAPGQQKTFSFNVTAPSVPGTFHFQWKMLREGVGWFGGASTDVAVSVTASSATLSATFISQSVPAPMTSGGSYTVSLTMLNSGTTPWTASGAYRLGSVNPANNTTWGFGRVNLASGETVASGQQKTFTFIVRAPAAAGTYNFEWKMLQEFVAWFGAASPNVAVQVK